MTQVILFFKIMVCILPKFGPKIHGNPEFSDQPSPLYTVVYVNIRGA